MKKIIILLFFLTIFPPCNVSAMEITSPFGWRTHPVTSVSRFHTGVDIGAEYGDSINAVMEGTAYIGYDPGGYGYFVEISHPDGSETLFGHCAALLVTDGQSVSAGQPIALAGSTGISTGPHVHVEYRIGYIPIDPVSLLNMAGWDLVYNGESIPFGESYYASDSNEMPWNFGDFYDVAQELRNFLNDFSEKCKQGLTYLSDDAFSILNVLMVIDLALASLFLAFADDGIWFMTFMRSFIKYSFFVWVISNWQTFINSFFIDGFFSMAVIAGGGGNIAADNLSDPAKIVQKGVFLVQPVFTFLTTFSGAHLIANIHHVFIAILLGIGIVFCFIVIGIQFFYTYLQFYVVCVLSLPSIPFGVNRHTQFLSEQGLSAVITAGLKLTTMILTVSLVVLGIGEIAPKTYDSVAYSYLLLVSMALVFFVSKIGTIVNMLKGSIRI